MQNLNRSFTSLAQASAKAIWKKDSSFSYISQLKSCIRKKSLAQGKLIHAFLIVTINGFPTAEPILCNTLLQMYCSCSDMESARRMFDEIPCKDACTWTLIISAYTKHGNPEESMALFRRMQTFHHHHVNLVSTKWSLLKRSPLGASMLILPSEMPGGSVDEQKSNLFELQMQNPSRNSCAMPNQFTFASVISACAALESIEQGLQIHELVRSAGFDRDPVVSTALVDMYLKCQDMDNARQVFVNMWEKDLVSWNALLAGFVRNGLVLEALRLFLKMPCKDSFSWTSMVSGLLQKGLIQEAWIIFGRIPEFHVAAWNAMIAGLAQNEFIDQAYELFQEMPQRDKFSWSSMISGFAQSGMVHEARKLLSEMPEQKNLVSWNAAISGLAQKGHVQEAFEIFKEMPVHDVSSWNAMISGFAQNGQADACMELFQEMKSRGPEPDSRTFVSLLHFCANFAALDQGMKIHDDIKRSSVTGILVSNALMDMYAKCGCVEIAEGIFRSMGFRNRASWSIMIAGYSMNGNFREAFQMLEKMQSCGIRPNHVTLLGILSACSHAGLLEEGFRIFRNMREMFGIEPTLEHCRCMVDILGRSGKLQEAKVFIQKMQLESDSVTWNCLLSACRTHKNVAMAEIAAGHVFELDPQNSAAYMLLSNIYADAGKWQENEKLQRAMKDKES